MSFIRTYFYCFLFLIATTRHITQFHEVIIVGAGVSGLRASQIFQQEGVPHIILESKNHIGGRIAPTHFEQEFVDIGSSFYSS
jgi:monoamine oxidase